MSADQHPHSPQQVEQQLEQQDEQQPQPETGFYVLRTLFDDVPVATEGDAHAHITCVEYWSESYMIVYR